MDNYEVDITLLCYNHGKYVARCLDSILSQKTNFKFRIFISDDCSTDNSQEVIREYEIKYPDIVFPIYNKKNMGVTKNSAQLKERCTSKYICGGESDDYWTDDLRLQKQYDFLENHPEFVAVGGNFYNVDSNGENPSRGLLKWQVDRSYSMNDYLKYGFIIHGNTLMRRNIIKKDERYRKLRSCAPTMGDVITRALLYDKGDIYCLKDVIHAHRAGNNEKSSFYTQSRSNPIKYCYMYNDIVAALNEYFDNKYNFNKLLAGRLSLVRFWKLMGINTYSKDEYRAYVKTLPWNIRVYSHYRTLARIYRSALHVVGRKLGF